jgi:CHAT domain-containing protein
LKLSKEDDPSLIINYVNLGDLLSILNRIEEAIDYYRAAIKIGEVTLGNFHPFTAIANLNLAETYFDANQLQNAMWYCQRALMSCVHGFTNESPLSNPKLANINSESILLLILDLKGRILEELSRIPSSSDYEAAALSTYNLASALIDRIRTGYTSESSKLGLGKQASIVYRNAIRMCIRLFELAGNKNYLNYAFRFSEKNKSSILSDALQESKAKTFAGIPDSILAKEKQLKIDLAFYETQILKEKQEEETPTIELSGNQEQFFALKRDYEEFIEQLEQQYPKYFDLKYQTETTTIQELQRRIDAETTVIEYFTAQNTIYIFTISNKDHTVTAAPKDSLFEKVIEELRASLQADNNEQYRRTAGQLYNILIQPIQERLDTPHLVIIPDGPLTAIPFEVLLENSAPSAPNASYPHLPYLMRKFDISYAYSATLFLETLDKPLPEHNKELIAFAPVFPDELSSGTRAAELFAANRAFDLSWTEEPIALPASRDEVLGIQQVFREQLGPIDWISDWLFDSKSLVVLEQEATEAHLKEIPLQNYNYVHFATHGFANRNVKNLSGLVFAQDSTSSEDDILFMDEIYNLELDAELVTLSACESGVGQLVQGEGLLNMSRGFLYAGARNLLVSLWKADDRSTCELMVAFYRNLLEGHSKARALKQAKLHMLNNPINAIPSQWAAFVLIGE